MKKSICCMAEPINHPGGISSDIIGICPKCGERTDFAAIVYKVSHPYDVFYTDDLREAKEQFNHWKQDGCDEIRLYEAIEDEEPEWDLIECYDKYEENQYAD